MLKTKDDKAVYRCVLFIFAVIMVVLIMFNMNIIDVIYLGIIFILVLSYFTCKK